MKESIIEIVWLGISLMAYLELFYCINRFYTKFFSLIDNILEKKNNE